jgi:perosamine synthetase
MGAFIPVAEPVLDGNERRYVLEALDENRISSSGRFVAAFEEAFAKICGARHGVACANGTAALHLALAALGIGPGDEVIVPDLTLICNANMVHLVGARAVFVDVDPKTWCIDPALIEAKVTPRTRAIMPVHLYGHPADMTAILGIARRRGLRVIEDAAEAHGAEVNGRRVGALGDVGCFSFYGNKILTTGEGGMCVTNDAALAEKMRLLRNQAFVEPRFVHHEVGFNYRLTNVQAAIGLAQCEGVDRKIERKREIASIYAKLLEGVTLPAEAPWAKNVYWMYGVLVPGDRDGVMRRMLDRGVETRPFFHPMHAQPVFRGRVEGEFPVSRDLGARGLYLPSGLGLTRAQQERVARALAESLRA